MKIEAAALGRRGAPLPYANSRPLSIETLDLDDPGRGEVRVRIDYASSPTRSSDGRAEHRTAAKFQFEHEDIGDAEASG